MKALPSIAGRLAWSLLASAMVWSLVVSAAVWLAVRHEVGELLDDTLLGAAEALRAEFSHVTLPALPPPDVVTRGTAGTTDTTGTTGTTGASPTIGATGSQAAADRYAWQVVQHDADGRDLVLARSPHATSAPLLSTPTAGFTQTDRWRVYGTALGQDGRMLYVAQSQAEQVEASLEVGFSAALATLAVALLSHLWLRSRAVHELAPLDRLSSRLKTHDLLAPGATLGAAERSELQPVHDALDALAAQLGQRLAHERAFNAHAAHALRTPLAGIDAQIAVALREAPPHLQPRLQRVRAAAGRLQRVVAALLALFRSGVSLQREPVDLPALLQRLPVDGLEVTVHASAPVHADVDLLSAALLNLLDNAVRHGALRLTIATPGPDRLLLTDDGPGVDDARRLALAAALAVEIGATAPADPATTQPPNDTDPGLGLGLKLAALVAQAHGGTLALPSSTRGFAVELDLQSRH